RTSGGTGALPPSLTSFITSYSPSSTRNDLSVVGQAVLIGPSQITVYEVGGRVVADNSQTHQIVICTDGPVPRLLCPGGGDGEHGGPSRGRVRLCGPAPPE